MGARIIVCEEDNIIPFYFSSADITVRNIYEAMFMAGEYGDKCCLELLSDEFVVWLERVCGNTLKDSTRTDFIIRCFRKYNYIDESRLKLLRKFLSEKEGVGRASVYKEKGDMYYKKGDYINACSFYFSAFNIEETAEVLNDIGLCLIALDDLKTGTASIKQASLMQPENENIAYNLAKAYMLCREYTKAIYALRGKKNRDCRFLCAQVNILAGEMDTAVCLLEKLYEEKPEERILYSLCRIYIEMRNFEQAAVFIEKTTESIDRVIMVSRFYAAKMDFVSAIKEIEKNLMKYRNNRELWLNLSRYYRLKGDYVRAEGAVCKAFTIDRENIETALEYAKVKNNSGRYWEYKARIEDILKRLKKKYREKEKFFVENI